MPEETEFDIAGALDTISADLGLGTENDTPPEPDPDTPPASAADTSDVPAIPAPDAPAEESAAPEETPKHAPPKTWRPEAVASWEALPETVKAEVLKREDDMFRGLEGYKAEANIGKSVKQVFQPYEPILRQQGIDPLFLTSKLMEAHITMSTGTPEQRLAYLHRVAQDYGVSLDAQGEPPYIDPQVASLQKQLEAVTSHIKGNEQRQQQEATQKIQSEIDAFASDPAHPYFDEVASDVAALIRGGAAATLADAYEKAVWANPTTRAKEQSRLTAESTARALKEAEAKAQAARKATSANVRSSAKAASGTAALGSIDDTLAATLAEIKSRA